MAKTTTRKRRAPKNGVEEADPIVGGEPADTAAESDPGSGDLGQAIDWVRRALIPFDGETRKKIIRAANVLMK